VTGSKVWTSFANLADTRSLLVAHRPRRPQAQGHHVDHLRQCARPGIEVRPIRTMNRTAHFSEVFYDEVRIPPPNCRGGLNEGWSVAMSTLSFERGTGFMATRSSWPAPSTTSSPWPDDHGPDGRRPAIADEEVARRLATARAEVAALRAMTYASVSRNLRQQTPGPEPRSRRSSNARAPTHASGARHDILGHAAFDSCTTRWSAKGCRRGTYAATVVSMGGGTPDIQRNIIAERVLGLPR